MSDFDVLDLTASQAIAAIASGDLDAAEYYEAYRARSAADELNAYCWVADERPDVADGPLKGVPVAVKDLFCTTGIPSQAGSKILEGYLPPYTSTVVRRLEEAGAAVVGKTNQDEFAMGSSTEHCAFGPTLNPWDRAKVPGGSSGGSAAAVAAGLAPWSIGTDTGGSIRQPAALCGIVGLKATYGAVSRFGMIAFASSLDGAGPFARDVKDTALLYSHMVGNDPRDATCVGHPEQITVPSRTDLKGLTLGVPEDLIGGEGVQPGIREAFENSLKLAQELGAELKTVTLPHAPHALSAYYVIAPAEASSNLARFDGVRYGFRKDAGDLMSMYTGTRHDGFGEEVKRRILIGTYALSSGYYDAYYGKAQQVRTKVAEDFKAAFSDVDLIVTPTAPTTAFGLGDKLDDPLAMYLNDLFTIPMSLAGTPAISIPNGLVDGLPSGLQLAGPAFSENLILDAAHALEGAIGFDGKAARA